MSHNLPDPAPDNVEALADAVNRFHEKLSPNLGEALKADCTRQFAHRTFDRSSVVVHYVVGGEVR